ncbi:MAG TPA: rhodanese-like domain-containing protein [Candidatus Binataceae bacterium]|nr:rhodanese-like domain-containing protein [Candidatus Binataceae bacterium]
MNENTSARVALLLESAGFPNVRALKGGYAAWAAEYPTEPW